MSNSYGAPPPSDPRINAQGIQPFSPLGMTPPNLTQLYNMLQQRNKKQYEVKAPAPTGWGQALQVAAPIVDQLGDNAQISRLMGGMQQQQAASATTVPGLPGGGDQSSSAGLVPGMPSAAAGAASPIPAAPPSATPQYPRIPYRGAGGGAAAEAAAINSGKPGAWKPVDDGSAELAQSVINSGPPPPGGASMGGQPGASYSQIMGGTAAPMPAGGGGAPVMTASAGGAAPAASSSAGAQPPAGATAGPAARIPVDPRAVEEYKAKAARATYLKSFPENSQEHTEGIKLEEELQKTRESSEKVTDPRTGDIQHYNPLSGGHESGLPKALAPGEGEAMGAELKSSHSAMTGIRGLAVTGSTNVEPYALAATKIAGELQQTGLLSADTQLMVERLKKQFNMPNSATPLAVLGQIRATVLNGMQSGAKSFATEGGEAARLFTTEVQTMQGELPALNATKEEQLAGWNSVLKRARKWGDDGLYFNDWVRKQPNGLPTSEIHSEIIRRGRAFQPYGEEDLKPSPGAPSGNAPAPGSPMSGMPQPTAPTPSQASTSAQPPPVQPPGSNFAERFGAATGPPPQAPSGGFPGPGITAQARTGLGLPGAVPPMGGSFGDISRAAIAKAHEHPGGLPMAIAGGMAPAGMGAILSALKGSHGLGDWAKGGLTFEGIHEIVNYLRGGK
jgi:hypothetical protein